MPLTLTVYTLSALSITLKPIRDHTYFRNTNVSMLLVVYFELFIFELPSYVMRSQLGSQLRSPPGSQCCPVEPQTLKQFVVFCVQLSVLKLLFLLINPIPKRSSLLFKQRHVRRSKASPKAATESNLHYCWMHVQVPVSRYL